MKSKDEIKDIMTRLTPGNRRKFILIFGEDQATRQNGQDTNEAVAEVVDKLDRTKTKQALDLARRTYHGIFNTLAKKY